MLNIPQERSTKDAAAVKVLTIIGLVYLPTTLVAVSSRIFQILNICLRSQELFLDTICSNKFQRRNTRLSECLATRSDCAPINCRHGHYLVVMGIRTVSQASQTNEALEISNATGEESHIFPLCERQGATG